MWEATLSTWSELLEKKRLNVRPCTFGSKWAQNIVPNYLNPDKVRFVKFGCSLIALLLWNNRWLEFSCESTEIATLFPSPHSLNVAWNIFHCVFWDVFIWWALGGGGGGEEDRTGPESTHTIWLSLAQTLQDPTCAVNVPHRIPVPSWQFFFPSCCHLAGWQKGVMKFSESSE